MKNPKEEGRGRSRGSRPGGRALERLRQFEQARGLPPSPGSPPASEPPKRRSRTRRTRTRRPPTSRPWLH